jgi:hypothetical protein
MQMICHRRLHAEMYMRRRERQEHVKGLLPAEHAERTLSPLADQLDRALERAQQVAPDRMLKGGISPGELRLVTGQVGMGKSYWAKQALRQWQEQHQGRPVTVSAVSRGICIIDGDIANRAISHRVHTPPATRAPTQPLIIFEGESDMLRWARRKECE